VGSASDASRFSRTLKIIVRFAPALVVATLWLRSHLAESADLLGYVCVGSQPGTLSAWTINSSLGGIGFEWSLRTRLNAEIIQEAQANPNYGRLILQKTFHRYPFRSHYPDGQVWGGFWRQIGFLVLPGGRYLTGGLIVVVPYWSLMILCAIVPAWSTAHAWRVRRRRKDGLCPSCGYDMRATPDRCPECGVSRAPITRNSRNS
jgi:hypothetical protein